MRTFLAVLAAWLLSATLASAQMMGISGGPFTVGSTYTGPGDITTFTAWYSVARPYSAAYAAAGGLAFNAVNSGSVTCDFAWTATGALGLSENCTPSFENGISLATLCLISCTVDEIYDETGGARHLLQATLVNQPTLTISCINSKPCAVTTAAATAMASAASFTPATGFVSMMVVANRSVGTSNGIYGENSSAGNRLRALAGANTWGIVAGGSGNFINATASDTSPHVFAGVINGASSVFAVDGVETTGSATGNTSAGAITFLGAGSTTILTPEWGFTDNAAWSPAVRASLHTNASAFYGTP